MKREQVRYYTRNNLELFAGSLEKHVYPWHYHDSYTIIWVESGAMNYVYRDKTVVVKRNEVHLVNPFTSHYNFPAKKCTYKTIFFPLNELSAGINRNAAVCFRETLKKDKKLIPLLNDLFEQLRHSTSSPKTARLQDALGGLLLQHFSWEEKKLAVDRRIIPAIEFVNKNLERKLTIKELSAKCFLSAFHFQRVFKEATGLTVHDFIQQQRTERAKKQLRNGSAVTDTVFEVGYFDPSHFYKNFKKMWVVNPAAVS